MRIFPIECSPREDVPLYLSLRIVNPLDHPIRQWLTLIQFRRLVHQLTIERGVCGVVAQCGGSLRGSGLDSRVLVIAGGVRLAALHIATLVTTERRPSLVD